MLFDGGEEGLRGSAEDRVVVLAFVARGFFLGAWAGGGWSEEAGSCLGDLKVRFAGLGKGLEVVFYRHIC